MVVMEEMGTPIGSYAPDFEVPGVDGEVHHLARYIERYEVIGVVFMANQCPYVAQCLELIKQLQREGRSQGVMWVGMNANDARQNPEESFEQMKHFAQEQQLNFPYLRDVTQDVAWSFGAVKTPEFFLLNHEGQLCYRRGLTSEDEALVMLAQDLRQAIAEILENQPVTCTIPESSLGTPIQWRA